MTNDLSTTTETGKSPGRYWLDLALETPDPGSMIGAAVTGLLAIAVRDDEAEVRQEQSDEARAELEEECTYLEQNLRRAQQTIDDILAVCKKSRGQLAEKVREVVDQAGVPPVPVEPTPDTDTTDPDPAE